MVQAIHKALDDENWYAALTLSLTLPDICTKYSDPTLAGKIRYPKWILKYMSPDHIPLLSGEDFYTLRCAFLHEGTGEVNIQSAQKVINGFVFVASKNRAAHRNRFNNTTQLDLTTFCEDICEAVDKWMIDFHPSMFNHKILNILVPIDGDVVTYDDKVKIIQADGRERWGLVYEGQSESLKRNSGSSVVSEDIMESFVEELKRIFLTHGFAMLLPRNKDFFIGFNSRSEFVIRGEHFGRINRDFQDNALEHIEFDSEDLERIRGMTELQIGLSLRRHIEDLFKRFYILQMKAVNDTSIVGYDLRAGQPQDFLYTEWDLMFLHPDLRWRSR